MCGLWQGQTEQEAAGRAPHRRYIADRPGEALPAHGIRDASPASSACPPGTSRRLGYSCPRLRPEERRVIADSQGDGLPSAPALR